MEELTKSKLTGLQNAVSSLNSWVAALCNIRPDLYSIKLVEWRNQLDEIRKQIGAKQMLLFIGPFSSGKSSFINALLGVEVLPSSNRPCTSVVTELNFVKGGGHRGIAVRKNNEKTGTEYDYEYLLKMIDGPTGAIGESAAYHHIELQFDITTVKDNACLEQLCAANVTIVDCPGYGSPYYSNEDVIEQYISKASHTFWINPADHMGRQSDVEKLKEIRKKTTTLIPIISKADLIKSEAEKDEARDTFAETIGVLFHSKEPIFCSAITYREGVELDRRIRKKEFKDAELKTKENERDRLFLQSGLSNVFAAVIDSASEKSVTDAKVNSVYYDLDKMMNQVASVAQKEREHWLGELKTAGWDEDRNAVLESARSDVDNWIEIESERVGRQLNSEITETVQQYLDTCGDHVDKRSLSDKVTSIFRNQIDSNITAWSRRYSDTYNRYSDTYNEKIRMQKPDNEICLPDWLNDSEVASDFREMRDVIFQSIKESGFETVLKGGIGAALLIAYPSITTIGIIGGALGSLSIVTGGALLAFAAIGFIPVYSENKKRTADKRRSEQERKISKWLDNMNMSGCISNFLRKQNNDLYERLEKAQQKTGAELIEKKNQCGNIITGLERLKDDLRIKFDKGRN